MHSTSRSNSSWAFAWLTDTICEHAERFTILVHDLEAPFLMQHMQQDEAVGSGTRRGTRINHTSRIAKI